jgi:glycerophosphoryl diester phosphodiesterase
MDLMAHRGASGLAPENTLAAFALALQHEPEWIELDVHATLDGELVVMHDPTVDRTTNGRGAIADMPLAELRTLDAGGWFGTESRGERVPLLEEVAALVGQRSRLNVEIKAGPDLAQAAAQVVEVLRAGGILARSEISSFDLEAVLAVQALTDEPALALITGRADSLALCMEHGLPWLNLHQAAVTAELIATAHAAGVRVTAWTINDLSRWDDFRALGVDVFCTDMCHLAPARGSR